MLCGINLLTAFTPLFYPFNDETTWTEILSRMLGRGDLVVGRIIHNKTLFAPISSYTYSGKHLTVVSCFFVLNLLCRASTMWCNASLDLNSNELMFNCRLNEELPFSLCLLPRKLYCLRDSFKAVHKVRTLHNYHVKIYDRFLWVPCFCLLDFNKRVALYLAQINLFAHILMINPINSLSSLSCN